MEGDEGGVEMTSEMKALRNTWLVLAYIAVIATLALLLQILDMTGVL